MNRIEIENLLNKYRDGSCSIEELALLEAQIFNAPGKPVLTEQEITDVKDEMRINLLSIVYPSISTGKSRRLWPRIGVVAAAVATITLGVWLYYASGLFGGRHPDSTLSSQVSRDLNDIAPGKNTATLTLANGETINLSDAKTGVVIGNDKLAYNDGSTVATLSPSGRDAKGREGNNSGNPLSPQGGSLPGGERSKVQMLTATTPRGGTYQVTLPDGTRVWLNADSKISFPSQFSGKERKILLSGEAYFEVAKAYVNNPSLPKGISPLGREVKKRMPFMVESSGQQVEVLGTHFNINAYADEASTKTTLLEGSVRVAFLSHSASRASLPLGERSIVLKPNQQSTISESNQIKITQMDPNEAIAWKNGKFVFAKEDIKSIMRKIGRWYDVEVVYEGDVENKALLGSVSRFKNVSEVLDMLSATKAVKFKIEGRKITVMRYNK